MPVTVEIPDVGSVDFPDEMGMDQIQAAVAKLHSQHAAPTSRMDQVSRDQPRIPIGVDPRLDMDTAFNPEETADAASAAAEGLTTYGGMAAGGPIGRVLASPYTWSAVAGGKTLLKTGDPVAAAEAGGVAYMAHRGLGKVIGSASKFISKALAARLEHQIARAAMAEAPAVTAATQEVTAPVVKMAQEEMDQLLIRATDATAPSRVRLAARAALQKAGWTPDAGMIATPVAEEAAPVVAGVAEAAPAVRRAVPIPVKGNVKPATVYTPTPVQGPKPLTEMQIVTRARQLEAAKAAGVDLGEAFGGAVRPGAQAEQAAESALETRLRASVMMKKDPMGLANEIAGRISEMSSAKPEKITDAIEALYGLPRANVKQMVEMVLREAAK